MLIGRSSSFILTGDTLQLTGQVLSTTGQVIPGATVTLTVEQPAIAGLAGAYAKLIAAAGGRGGVEQTDAQ